MKKRYKKCPARLHVNNITEEKTVHNSHNHEPCNTDPKRYKAFTSLLRNRSVLEAIDLIDLYNDEELK